MLFDLAIKGGTLVLPGLGLLRADLALKGERIAGLFDPTHSPRAREIIAAKGKYVLPGIIEPHAHLGLGDPVKDYLTETSSAALGGVTTVISLLRGPAPIRELYEDALAAAAPRSLIDYAFRATLMTEEHLRSVRECFESLGVTSFKFYLTYRGPDAEIMGIPGIDDGFLYECMREVASLPGALLCLHAENIEIIQRLRQKLIASGRADLRAFSESRPSFTEAEAIGRATSLAGAAGCPILFLHLSSREGLEEVRRGRERFPSIYVETAPTFLTLTEDSDLGAVAKVKPPLRKGEDLEALWRGLKDGTIDTVGSDHVPRKRALKEADLWNPVTGVPGVATLLPVLLSEGVHKRGMSLEQVARVTSFNPARLYGLYPRKGCLAPGSEADLTLVDPELEKEVRAEELLSHADYSLYEGWRLKGWPVLTMVRGKVVMRDGKILGEAGCGRYVPRAQGLSSRSASSGRLPSSQSSWRSPPGQR